MTAKMYLKSVYQLLSVRARRRLPLLFLAFLLAASLDLVGISLIGPFVAAVRDPGYFTQSALGRGISSLLPSFGTDSLLYTASAMLILVFVLKAIVTFFVNRGIYRFCFAEQAALRDRLLHNYLSLSLEDYVNTRSSSDLFASVLLRTNQYTNQTLIPMLKAAAAALIVTSLLGFLFVLHWQASLALTLSLTVLVISYDRVVRRRARCAGREVIQRTQGLVAELENVSNGFKEIRTLGCEEFFAGVFSAHTHAFGRASAFQQSLTLLPRQLLESLLVAAMIIALLATMLVDAAAAGAQLAALGAFSFAGLRAVQSTGTLLDASNQMRFGLHAVSDLTEQLAVIEPKARANPIATSAAHDRNKIIRLERALSARQLTYRYPGTETNALDAMDLEIRRGQSIGIVGASGCGKTTLVEVLLGLLAPAQGEVCVDGTSIRGRERAWMASVAYIPQSVFLIAASIRENIALGLDPKAIDSTRLAYALRSAQLEDFVERLPDGLSTTVGQRGMRLSGGQRQRIALARALYLGKDVIVMDEATAALDHKTEAGVMEAIHALRGSKTLIIIAHRTSTLKRCDEIIRLDQGRIVQRGKYAETVGRVDRPAGALIDPDLPAGKSVAPAQHS